MRRDGGNAPAAGGEALGQGTAPAPPTRPRWSWRRALRRPPAVAGAAIVLLFAITAIGAPWIATRDPIRTNWSQIRKPPTMAHLFGTDDLGRDVYSRVVWGARTSMQAGVLSLMQMAKTSAKLARLADAGIPYISVLTDPTTGGVTASFSMLGDVHIAEPGALIGFAGPRVIKQTIGKYLPPGFQRSEFLLEHGFVDQVVQRKELKNSLTQIISLLTTP